MINDFNLDIYSNGKVFSKDFCEEIDNGIMSVCERFAKLTKIRGNEDKLEFLREYCVPPLGAENINSLFGEYGETISHICSGFFWDNERLEQITEVEYWKMIALSSIFWEKFYEDAYDRQCKKDIIKNGGQK